MDDYISRLAAIDGLEERIKVRLEWNSDSREERQGLNVAMCVIEDLPSADVQPVRHGRWIIGDRTNVYGGREIMCNVCGESFMVSPMTLNNLSECERYCCRCGAKMDGGSEE